MQRNRKPGKVLGYRPRSRYFSPEVVCMSLRLIPVALWTLGLALHAQAGDWPQFRGPEGKGDVTVAGPATWGQDSNILWQVKLPGPGASSPIILGDKLFVTSYSGFGVTSDGPGAK